MKWGFKGKSVLEIVHLLGLPLIAFVTGLFFTINTHVEQEKRELRESEETQRIASNNSLNEYFGNISNLMASGLGDNSLTSIIQGCTPTPKGKRLASLGRAYTAVAISQLKKKELRQVISFLYSTGLINTTVCSKTSLRSYTWIDLHGFDFSEVDLSGLFLVGSNFSYVSFEKANFFNTPVGFSNFFGANLIEVNFGFSSYGSIGASSLWFGQFDISSNTQGNSSTILPLFSTYPNHWLTEKEIVTRDLCKQGNVFRPYASKEHRCLSFDFLEEKGNFHYTN